MKAPFYRSIATSAAARLLFVLLFLLGSSLTAAARASATALLPDTNSSLYVDGVGGYAIAPLDGTALTQVTVEMWVRPTVMASRGIFQWASTDRSAVPFVYYYDQGGTFYLYADLSYVISTPLPTNIWTHIAATNDGTTWRLYKNGTLVGSYAGGRLYQSTAEVTSASDFAHVLRSRILRIDCIRIVW